MPKMRSDSETIKSSNLSQLRESAIGTNVEETWLLTVAEVAERLHTSQMFVRRLINDNQLPAVRIGNRSIRVKAVDLAHFINTHRDTVEHAEEDLDDES